MTPGITITLIICGTLIIISVINHFDEKSKRKSKEDSKNETEKH